MKIHGQWQVTLVGNILVRSFAGHFNDQGTNALFNEYKSKAPVGTRWASLAHGKHWEMSSQSSLQAYGAMKEWATENGCECIAFIYPTNLHLNIVEQQTGAQAHDDFYPCKSIEEAAAWLTSKGFPFACEDFPHTEFIKKSAEKFGAKHT